MAERPDQGDHVLRQHALPVGIHLRRATGITITAQIRRHRVVTGLGQYRQLVAPGGPTFRKAMQTQHQRVSRFPGLRHEKIQTIGSQLPLTHKCHTHSSRFRFSRSP